MQLIAQQPNQSKEKTPMLVCDFRQQMLDKQVIDFIDYIEENDVVVFNDAKVIKAKLRGYLKRSDAWIDFNLDRQLQSDQFVIWNALCRPAKKIKQGDVLEISTDFMALVKEKLDSGFIILQFNYPLADFFSKIDLYGEVPLPPYIKRDKSDKNDQNNYQTIYAKNGVAVAAPTAGLHFDQKIIDKILQKKAKIAFVTLNVGAGTFLPVKSDMIKDHKMHSESFFVSQENADIINEAKKENKKIIAVGTTTLRVLESIMQKNNKVKAGFDETDIFIYPPYDFKIVDMLLTNFHLPKSTLFMLVCAFIGKNNAHKLYNHAIAKKYRFYSYGDCTLLIRNNF